jgi:hypothetical protein
MLPSEDRVLKIRVERSETTTEKDVKDFYTRVYKMAENLGFNVVTPKTNNQHLALRVESENE